MSSLSEEVAVPRDRARSSSDDASLPRLARWRLMVSTGLSMMLHDRLKLAGTIFGVVFAVLICVQQIGVLLGLLSKNTMFVDQSKADVWIAPVGTRLLQSGPLLPRSALYQAKVVPGVELAAPLVFTGASVEKPGGGTEPITLVGTELPHLLGGPWNVVAGRAEDLAQPGAIFFEDSKRDAFGGLNLDSVREVNERQVRVVGFTWGLEAFAPAYSFAEIGLARELAGIPTDRVNFVLVKLAEGADVDATVERLRAAVPSVEVFTTKQFHDRIVKTLLEEQLGISFGTSVAFGLLIGLVVVSLAMFSSVLENQRQFGTLKALGCSNVDLTLLVLTQSLAYALIGSFVGLGLVTKVAEGIRSPELAVIIPGWLMGLAPIVMIVICLFASLLALSRVWRLEPGMVFR
ncbi:ABC transporter permease [Myxococcota bacterium]|nr:ABC transporter permease [Myxococcota bacterium]